jgi:hypothetical protein
MKPELKNINKLRIEDFDRHPIWVNCHSADYGKEWYNKVNEDIMRPYLGSKPVGTEAMYLVRATLKLSDGTEFVGCVTPSDTADDWGTIQPRLISKSMSPIMFWWGACPQDGMDSSLYRVTDRTRDQIFPIQVSALAGLTTSHCSGIIKGFMIWTPGAYEIV